MVLQQTASMLSNPLSRCPDSNTPSPHSSSENSRPALSRDLDFVAMKPSCFQNFSTVALLVTTQGLFHALEGLHAVMPCF
jgi:hypothetical protein